MTTMSPHILINRFGLGLKGEDPISNSDDVFDLLLAEIDPQLVRIAPDRDLPPSGVILKRLRAYYEQRKSMAAKVKTTAVVAALANSTNPQMAVNMVRQERKQIEFFTPEVAKRFQVSYFVPRLGFAERLVMFWNNHFATSVNKGLANTVLAGAFEREAIRPHVFGRFEDMLIASTTHPAMLIYLDNQISIGPKAKKALMNAKSDNDHKAHGLNENLAREIMELHTLGVGGGYSQADVTAFARVLTGWGIDFNSDPRKNPTGFEFTPKAHEPGAQTILGHAFANNGQEQGLEVLKALARHPSTADHVATKLATHFVADTPPEALVSRLRDIFLETDGNLMALSQALIEAPEAISETRAKMRLPLEYWIATLRALNMQPQPQRAINALNAMGQPMWEPSGPNGFSDRFDVWASPAGLHTRLELIDDMTQGVMDYIDPRELANTLLGSSLSDTSRTAIAHAETRAQGLAILFLSPEFLRR